MTNRHDNGQVARLGIGGAQFGLDYGATNRGGKVAPGEVRAILAAAREAGISMIDTAAQYGDSEAVIGAAVEGIAGFEIITKTADLSAATAGKEAVELLRQGVETSLARLGTTSLDGLLFHRVDDLTGPFGDALWRAAEDVRRDGLARRIGVSVYSGGDIAAVADRFGPDIVQVPINAFDGRLDADGSLSRLTGAGVEIHARSVFLQGVALAEPEALPAHLAGLAGPLTALRRAMGEAGVSLEAGLLAAVLCRPAIARIIVGVTSRAELAALIEATNEAGAIADRLQFERYRLDDPAILDPSRWPAS